MVKNAYIQGILKIFNLSIAQFLPLAQVLRNRESPFAPKMTEQKPITGRVLIGLIFILLFAGYSIVFMEVDYMSYISKEDGPLENLGALGFCAASLVFFILYFQSGGFGNEIGALRTEKNIFYLAVGLMFFVAFAEEISWGQRIFGWHTPDEYREMNLQGETNLHNLPLFQSFWKVKGIFKFVCLTYFLIIPLINKWVPQARKLFTRIGFPIPPIWIGLLFFAQTWLHDWSKDYLKGYPRETTLTLKELEECLWGIIAFIFSCAEWLKTNAMTYPLKVGEKLERPA